MRVIYVMDNSTHFSSAVNKIKQKISKPYEVNFKTSFINTSRHMQVIQPTRK